MNIDFSYVRTLRHWFRLSSPSSEELPPRELRPPSFDGRCAFPMEPWDIIFRHLDDESGALVHELRDERVAAG
jgi:hypothetical protein